MVRLLFGLFLMFAPVAWLVLSSFKTEGALLEFPPTLLPYGPKTVAVGPDRKELPVFVVRRDDGSSASAPRSCAPWRRWPTPAARCTPRPAGRPWCSVPTGPFARP